MEVVQHVMAPLSSRHAGGRDHPSDGFLVTGSDTKLYAPSYKYSGGNRVRVEGAVLDLFAS